MWLWILQLCVEMAWLGQVTWASHNGCQGVLRHPQWTLCCGGHVYIRGGPEFACCGPVAYDGGDSLCCQGVVRRRHGNARCCGSRGYDVRFGTCVGGQIRRRSDLGSSCCYSGGSVICCRNSEGCCDGDVLPGFRPACCDGGVGQAECCSDLVRRTLLLPSCCASPEVRPVCCHKQSRVTCCPPGRKGPECCVNDLGVSSTTHRPTVTTVQWNQQDVLPCCRPGEYTDCRLPRPCHATVSHYCCYDVTQHASSEPDTTVAAVSESEELSQTTSATPTPATTRGKYSTAVMPPTTTRATRPPFTTRSSSGLVALQLSCCIAPNVAGCCVAASRITSITPHCCMPG